MTPTPEQLAAAEQIDLEHVKKVRNCVVFIEAPNGVEETQAVIDLIPALVHLLKQARAECDYNLRACNDAQIIIRETRMERDAEWQRKDVVHREAISSLRTAMPDADQIARWKAAEAVAEFDILVEDMEESGIASKFEELKSRGKATLAAYRALTEKQNG